MQLSRIQVSCHPSGAGSSRHQSENRCDEGMKAPRPSCVSLLSLVTLAAAGRGPTKLYIPVVAGTSGTKAARAQDTQPDLFTIISQGRKYILP